MRALRLRAESRANRWSTAKQCRTLHRQCLDLSSSRSAAVPRLPERRAMLVCPLPTLRAWRVTLAFPASTVAFQSMQQARRAASLGMPAETQRLRSRTQSSNKIQTAVPQPPASSPRRSRACPDLRLPRCHPREQLTFERAVRFRARIVAPRSKLHSTKPRAARRCSSREQTCLTC
jgi:hypothetical protein